MALPIERNLTMNDEINGVKIPPEIRRIEISVETEDDKLGLVTYYTPGDPRYLDYHLDMVMESVKKELREKGVL